ncbi:MAG: hypothetical protein QOJ07_3774 [Thermoleophilaceae bacterium]|jgi:hypothetical protein|nr:hypothetical protein [Thermoleophilaceae bacterium]
MAILELVKEKPDWVGALAVAMTRPAGVPERRAGEDPWNPSPAVARPRRISDDLAWFRRAVDDPADHGLRALDDSAAVSAWESDRPEPIGHLERLRERGVLDAAGFLLHEPDRVDL